MSTTQIVSKRLDVTSAINFVNDVTSGAAYYVFAAKHTPYAGGDATIPTPNDAVVNNYINIYNDMLFGKKVQSTDVKMMINRYDWTANTTYAMYDDTDAQLYTKQFYASVNAGAQYHIYKCLFNDSNTASTEEPSGTDNDAFETSDGYIWKYIASTNNTIMTKFGTAEYMPLQANTSVVSNAVSGSIEVIVVEDGGAGYNNFLTSHFNENADIKVSGNESQYALGANASTISGFYNNTLLRITSGAAKDEMRVITSYTVGAQKVAIIDDPFDNLIAVNDTFEIFPFVEIFDKGGSKDANCIARAIIGGTGNVVSRVEVMTPGSGYRSAAALIRPANTVGVVANASLRVVASPPNGHGSNCFSELAASYAGLAVKFVENEGVAPELRTENDYRQIGLLRNPLFANVRISFSSNTAVGTFLPAENVLQYDDIRLFGTVNTSSNSTITGNDTLFQNNINVGDRLLITSGVNNVLGNVVTITSNTLLTLDVNASFTSTSCNISLVNAFSYGTISANSANEIFVGRVNVSSVSNSLKFIGEASFCSIVASNVQIARGGSSIDLRNTNNFGTFSQLTKLQGTIDSGTFTPDESLSQEAATGAALGALGIPKARLFAAIEDGAVDYLYVTNVENTFETGAGAGVTTGNTSDASFTVEAKYDGELIPGSGEVMYIENFAPISRSNNQTETIKLLLEF